MRRRRREKDSGVSSLELAIIAPSLIFLIFLVIQGALYFYGRSVALQAARDGVSQLRLQSAATCEANRPAIETSVKQFAASIGNDALTAVTATGHCGQADPDDPNQHVSVTVTGHSISLIGITFSVTETARGQVEQFVGDG